MSLKRDLPKQLATIASGEDSSQQFKQDFNNPDQLAAEMASFANAEGGTIYIGVNDRCEAVGLSMDDVARINQLISNVASQGVRSPLVVNTQNVRLSEGRVVIVLKVPKGIDKPYFDKNGVIWFRVGADKRRVNSKEELRRFFQMSDQFHADELPTKAGVEALDRLRFRDFLRDKYDLDYPEDPKELLKLLQNLNLATGDGALNLAGLLLFTEHPDRFKPEFVLKAVSYPGDRIHVSTYDDTEDFEGPLSKVFEGALGFVLRNLRRVQAGRGVNSPGTREIPPVVFEELLVNALVHRDYMISAPIRLFVYSDRVEIVSPGNLPNNLTVDKIRAGNSNLRNPILASYAAKGLLPYRGLGSGVPRAIESWPQIGFYDDRDGNLFVATVRRDVFPLKKNGPEEETVGEDSEMREKTPEKPENEGENGGETTHLKKKKREKTQGDFKNEGENVGANPQMKEKTESEGENNEVASKVREETSEKPESEGENGEETAHLKKKKREKTQGDLKNEGENVGINPQMKEKTENEGENNEDVSKMREKTLEKPEDEGENVGETAPLKKKKKEKTSEKILAEIVRNPAVTTRGLMESLTLSKSTVERNLQRLQQENRIRRVGPDKGGHWEVIA